MLQVMTFAVLQESDKCAELAEAKLELAKLQFQPPAAVSQGPSQISEQDDSAAQLERKQQKDALVISATAVDKQAAVAQHLLDNIPRASGNSAISATGNRADSLLPLTGASPGVPEREQFLAAKLALPPTRLMTKPSPQSAVVPISGQTQPRRATEFAPAVAAAKAESPKQTTLPAQVATDRPKTTQMPSLSLLSPRGAAAYVERLQGLQMAQTGRLTAMASRCLQAAPTGPAGNVPAAPGETVPCSHHLEQARKVSAAPAKSLQGSHVKQADMIALAISKPLPGSPQKQADRVAAAPSRLLQASHMEQACTVAATSTKPLQDPCVKQANMVSSAPSKPLPGSPDKQADKVAAHPSKRPPASQMNQVGTLSAASAKPLQEPRVKQTDMVTSAPSKPLPGLTVKQGDKIAAAPSKPLQASQMDQAGTAATATRKPLQSSGVKQASMLAAAPGPSGKVAATGSKPLPRPAAKQVGKVTVGPNKPLHDSQQAKAGTIATASSKHSLSFSMDQAMDQACRLMTEAGWPMQNLRMEQAGSVVPMLTKPVQASYTDQADKATAPSKLVTLPQAGRSTAGAMGLLHASDAEPASKEAPGAPVKPRQGTKSRTSAMTMAPIDAQRVRTATAAAAQKLEHAETAMTGWTRPGSTCCYALPDRMFENACGAGQSGLKVAADAEAVVSYKTAARGDAKASSAGRSAAIDPAWPMSLFAPACAPAAAKAGVKVNAKALPEVTAKQASKPSAAAALLTSSANLKKAGAQVPAAAGENVAVAEPLVAVSSDQKAEHDDNSSPSGEQVSYHEHHQNYTVAHSLHMLVIVHSSVELNVGLVCMGHLRQYNGLGPRSCAHTASGLDT